MRTVVYKLGYLAAFGTDRSGRVLGLSFADILLQGGVAIGLLVLIGMLV